MSKNFNETPTLSNPFQAVTAANALAAKTLQAVATETSDYSKQAFEKCRDHFEKLKSVRKLEEAIQLQSDFAKTAFEDFVAEATKIGEIYSDLAKEALTPLKTASLEQLTASAAPTDVSVPAKQIDPSTSQP